MAPDSQPTDHPQHAGPPAIPPGPPVVDSWSSPTTVYAGEQAVAHVAELVGGRPGLILTDQQVWLTSPVAAGVRRLIDPVHVVAREPGAPDGEFVATAALQLARTPDAVVLGVGGGSVLDVARIVALGAQDPDFARQVANWNGGASIPRVLMWPAARASACGCVCVPTTFGTAAEVSPVAVLRRGGATTLFISPALRARAALLDPIAGATLSPVAARSGLVEPLSRVLVPAVAGEPLELQDRMGRALFEALVHLGHPDARLDDRWRMAAALASAQTHTAFLSLGRSPFGHALWPCATELMAATGAGKPMVLSWLLPAWARGLVSGQLRSPVFGSPARLAALTGWPAAEVPARLGDWCAGLGLAEESALGANARSNVGPAVDVHEVATAVRLAWQASGWFLSGARPAELEWLIAEATA